MTRCDCVREKLSVCEWIHPTNYEMPVEYPRHTSNAFYWHRSNCLPHLEKNNIKDVAGFLKAPASDLKAIGFRGEVCFTAESRFGICVESVSRAAARCSLSRSRTATDELITSWIVMNVKTKRTPLSTVTQPETEPAYTQTCRCVRSCSAR